MNSITIREALAEDASQLLEYMKTVGAETENLYFYRAGGGVSGGGSPGEDVRPSGSV